MKRVEDICKTCRKRSHNGFCTQWQRVRAGFCGYRGHYAEYDPEDPTIDREARIEEYYAFQKSLDWLDSANA